LNNPTLDQLHNMKFHFYLEE